MTYIDKLIDNCQRAKAARPVSEFEFSDSSQLNGIKRAIYIIEEIGGDSAKTFNALKEFKSKQRKEDKGRACPRLNAPSKVMYVGSSTTGLKTRIKQHRGQGTEGTYALHLEHWFDGEYRIRVKVYDEPKEVLQIIEDAISYDLSPAFGKQGGNNK